MGLACSPPRPIPGVVQPHLGEELKSIPGPMPGFGPFPSFSAALIAACPMILEKPQATAGRPSDPNFRLRWQLSREYCAWLYYTPDHQYELSMLTASAVQDDPHKRKCRLPPVVDDQRYPQGSLGYVFVLHNHPFADILSEPDIRFIVSMGALHGWAVETKTGKVPLATVAFFSNSNDFEHPTCDGFFEYIPVTGELLKWTVDSQGEWRKELTGTVTWTDESTYRIDRK